MIKIEICDTTLRDGEQTPGVHFGISQKLDIALRLEAMGMDVIEASIKAYLNAINKWDKARERIAPADNILSDNTLSDKTL